MVREDAAQMAALQIQAEHGASLVDRTEEFESAMEQYLTKQVRCRMRKLLPLRWW